MSLTGRFKELKSGLPDHVKLIAVSKTKPIKDIECLYEAGHRYFGENKVQELVEKHQALPKDIQWHFIGHLQTNKVRLLAPFVSLIHGIDSFKLLSVVNKEGVKIDRVIDCLFQFHIASEESKFGLSLDEAKEILSSNEFEKMKNVRIVGVMGMATYTNDSEILKNEFMTLKNYFNQLKDSFFKGDNGFCELSMGMSGDFQLAIEEGSTMVRVGSLIFGDRNYLK